MTALAFVFPGQGSQKVGMGGELVETSPAARLTLEEADDALGFGLSALMRDGPSHTLKLTENAQPAILTAGIAALRALHEQQDYEPKVAAGHSLGEFGALVAAGVMKFEDAVRAVRDRGRFMQEAVPVGLGAMAAVIGMKAERVESVLAQVSTDSQPVAVAGINTPQQVTISGAATAVTKATQELKAAGARRVLPLNVSAPFHSPLMEPVVERLRETLSRIELRPFSCPVVSNVDARPYEDPELVESRLLEQLTKPVRWVDSVHTIGALGVDLVVELGSGTTLASMIKKIDSNLPVLSVQDRESLEQMLEAIAA